MDMGTLIALTYLLTYLLTDNKGTCSNKKLRHICYKKNLGLLSKQWDITVHRYVAATTWTSYSYLFVFIAHLHRTQVPVLQ